MSELRIHEVQDKKDLREMAAFPWVVYRGDKNWVPPILKDREAQLDPDRNRFFRIADVARYIARRDDRMVGTIAAFIDHRFNEYFKQRVGFFGFFEVLDDYEAAEALLSTARDWVRARGTTELRGPINFHRDRERGILVSGADCPPPMLCAHNPPYYREFVERFGMVKHDDSLARRLFASQFLDENGNIPLRLRRLAEAAERRTRFSIRQARFEDWDHEVALVGQLYDATIGLMPDHIPWEEEDLKEFAEELRPIIDPAFALFGEVDGRTIGMAIAFPDFNQVLIHLNGRLDGLNKLKAWWYLRQVKVLSFKIAGVLEEYQGRGLEALLLLKIAERAVRRGYEWVDLSLNAEENDRVATLAAHFGAEEYKRYRVYKMPV